MYDIFRRVKAVGIDEPDEGCPRTANRRAGTVRPTLVAGTAGRAHGRRPLDTGWGNVRKKMSACDENRTRLLCTQQYSTCTHAHVFLLRVLYVYTCILQRPLLCGNVTNPLKRPIIIYSYIILCRIIVRSPNTAQRQYNIIRSLYTYTFTSILCRYAYINSRNG